MESGRHAFLFSVTDKRTEVKTLKLFYVNATTITSEGWMLLCDEGSEERVRLDMLAQISVDRIVPAYDVIRRKDGVPEQYHAANIGFYATGSATGNRIIAMSEDAAYWLETTDSKGGGEFLDVESYHELKSAMFLAATDDHIVNFVSVPYKGLYKPEHDAVICVSREGNVYAWNTVEVETGFEYPINTSVRGGTPEYKVAPYVGTTLKRPLSSDFGIALLGLILFLLLFVGASAGSTAGGMKVVRVYLLFKNSFVELKRIIHPNGIINVKYNNKSVHPNIMTGIMAFAILFMIVFTIGSLIMTIFTEDIITACSAVVSSMSNVGPGFGSVGPMFSQIIPGFFNAGRTSGDLYRHGAVYKSFLEKIIRLSVLKSDRANFA